MVEATTVNPVLVKPALGVIPKDVAREQEIVEKRRPNGKNFDLGNGQFKAMTHLGQVHYKDNPDDENEGWKEIDLTITDEAGKRVVRKAPYDVEIWTDKVGYSYISKRGGRVDVELVEVGGQPVDNSRFSLRQDGNVIWWDNVAGGLDLKIHIRSLGVEIYKRLADENAPRKLKWKVSEDKNSKAHFRRKVAGVDNGGDALEMVTKILQIQGGFYFEEEWTGRVGKIINKSTRQKDWLTDVKYPVVIDASTSEDIVSNLDDATEVIYEVNGGTSTWLDFNRLSAGRAHFRIFNNYYYSHHGGVRFQSLGIPQGVTIDSADLVVNKSSIIGSPQTKIYADDVDDAAQWSGNNRPSQITKTTASKSWSPTGTGTESISITSLVQEIVSRTGWTSNNDIRFALLNQLPRGYGLDDLVILYDYNDSPANTVNLEVTYTPLATTKPQRALRGVGL